MKKLLFLILAGFTLIACQQSGQNTTADDADVVYQTVELQVKGMTCEGCENTINTTLAKMDGVKECESSHTEEFTKVVYNQEKISKEELVAAINDLSYQVIDDTE